MTSLEEDIRDAIPEHGDYSVIVEDSHRRLVSSSPEFKYETASTAKISVAYAILDMVSEGELDSSEPLELKKYHKRGGTGILRHFGNGFTISLLEALQLLLLESDNTAANLLLERVGGQSNVNTRLYQQGFDATGLTERRDVCFESGVADVEQMFWIWKAFIQRTLNAVPGKPPATTTGQACLMALRNSHFTHGFRSCERVSARIVKPIAAIAKPIGFLRLQSLQHRILAEFILQQKDRSQIASKEGVLPNHEGKSYLHELGYFFREDSRGGPRLAAVFSSGSPEDGYTIEEAMETLAKIGWAINSRQ